MSMTLKNSGQNGFSMVELLVAILILAFGLLGLAMAQTAVLKQANATYLRTQASVLMQDMSERIRANTHPSGLAVYAAVNGGSVPSAPASPCISTMGGCTADDVAKTDVAEWLGNLASLLPGGSGTITAGGTDCFGAAALNQTTYVIQVTWNELTSKGHSVQCVSNMVATQ